MQHQTHIGAIHPHAKGHGGHEHRCGVVLEVLQRQLAAFWIQAGVIRNRLDAGPPEPGGPLLYRAAGAGIDQHGAPGPTHRLQHLGQGIGGSQGHAIAEVGAAGRTHLHQRAAELEQADDVGPDLGPGRGAQGHQGHPGAEGTQLAQTPVVGPEIVAPGADAVGLVHRQCHQLTRFDHILEQLAGGLRLQPLRSQIEEAQAVIPQALQQLAALLGGEAPVQTGSGNAAALQLAHLVLHQGHQGRDHHHQSLAHQGRQLITERLASPGGQHRQTVPAGQQRLHHGPLARPEALPAEMPLQRLGERIVRHRQPPSLV